MIVLSTAWKYFFIACMSRLSYTIVYEFECYEDGSKPRVIRVDFQSFNLLDQCRYAVNVSYRSPEPVLVSGLTHADASNLFRIAHLHMCLLISQESYAYLDFLMKQLTGDCEGPLLRIIGNPELEYISVGDFINDLEPDAIQIRGNPLLPQAHLDLFSRFFDIQVQGECFMPSSLDSHLSIPSSCSRLYGIMRVDGSSSSADTDNGWRDYVYNGCIQLKSTSLTNVNFLFHFKSFTVIPGCKQYICNNTNLCVGYPSDLRKMFGDIDIYNNRMDCPQQCNGGVVDENYLDETSTCVARIGDVVITDLKNLPRNVDVLYKTVSIEGRLIILNNIGLGNFDYLKNVEVIGSPLIDGEEPVIRVENNDDLESLDLSSLSKVMQHEKNILIRIANNDKLLLSNFQRDSLIAAAGDVNFVEIHRSHTMLNNGRLLILILLIILVIALGLFSGIALFNKLYSRRLTKKSRIVLSNLCKEILGKNPFVWAIQDRPLLWRYTADDPKRNDIEQLKMKHAKFLKNHAIEVLSNACIPTGSERCISDRIKNIIKRGEILVIATENDISLVITSLPNEIGDKMTYNGEDSSITFGLQDVKYINELTQCYIYQVTIVKGQKATSRKLKAFVYIWDPLRLPISFNELLSTLALSTKKKLTCVSNRRKEIFFLLHMIFTYVTVLKESISIVEAFQFHTDNFNGAPMDRCEMLCVMAFVLEWAYQMDSIPLELTAEHHEWCNTYARMSDFYKSHPNIMVVHPEHLISSRTAILRKEINQAGPCAGDRFSERPREVIDDKFRRRTAIEMKAKPQASAEGQVRKVGKDDDGTTVNETGITTQDQYQFRGK